MKSTPELEAERNAALQKFGRNAVNLQKLEAMLKFLLLVSDHTAPVSTFSAEHAKRAKRIARMPMGELVERTAQGAFRQPRSEIRQRAVLLGHFVGIPEPLSLQHRVLGGFEHGVEPSKHGEGQDHVAVLAAYVDIAQPVIGNVPDEVRNLLDLALVLLLFLLHRNVPQLVAVASGASFQCFSSRPTRRF
jgi:hypothetical protein